MPKQIPLCDWSKKDLQERWDELRQLVAETKYACMKCGRAAKSKEMLCKPARLRESRSKG